MISDMSELENKLYFTKGYEAGVQLERKRIIVMAQARICFDFHQSGKCNHSVCYGMAELVETIAEALDD
jgi:hypothetical protein